MKIARFLAILLLMTALGLTLGAVSGGLLGAAVPMQVTVEGQSDLDSSREAGATSTVAVNTTADRTPIQSGAALGGGIGLFCGVGVGLVIGVLDQILLYLRFCSTQKRATEDSSHG